jgi:hypothetical protein
LLRLRSIEEPNSNQVQEAQVAEADRPFASGTQGNELTADALTLERTDR